jgi:hypothetical protein
MDCPTADMAALEAVPATGCIFLHAIQNFMPSQPRAAITKLKAFFTGTYPCLDGDVLKWEVKDISYAGPVIAAHNTFFSRYMLFTSLH